MTSLEERFEFFKKPNITEIKKGRERVIATNIDFLDTIENLFPNQYLEIGHRIIPQRFRKELSSDERNYFLHHGDSIKTNFYTQKYFNLIKNNFLNVVKNKISKTVLHEKDQKIFEEKVDREFLKYYRRHKFKTTPHSRPVSHIKWSGFENVHNIYYLHDCIEAAQIINWIVNHEPELLERDQSMKSSFFLNKKVNEGAMHFPQIPKRSKLELKDYESSNYIINLKKVPLIGLDGYINQAQMLGLKMEFDHQCPYSRNDFSFIYKGRSYVWDQHTIAALWEVGLEESLVEEIGLFPVPTSNAINLHNNLQKVIVYEENKNKNRKGRLLNEGEIEYVLQRKSLEKYAHFWDSLRLNSKEGTLDNLQYLNFDSLL